MAEQPNPDDLMWIQEAIVVYRHSREWFNARMREGKLEKVGLPGDGKIYFRRDQLEEVIRARKEVKS
ncbi:MAG TPA: hypothetical protein VJN88_05755 [Ktedonobacterales bacterium]|nr:hypothetical protein [Ktedonobacterales bacterium]